MLPRSEKNDGVGRIVTAMIEREFAVGAVTTVADVASNLGLSVRTLQRRIHGEGTHFSELVDSARREMAKHALGEASCGRQELSRRLGYSQVAVLDRAIRRWHAADKIDVNKGKAPIDE